MRTHDHGEARRLRLRHQPGIEFHDGSVHRKVGRTPVRILVDEEFRGE